jgi:hypothetical protein
VRLAYKNPKTAVYEKVFPICIISGYFTGINARQRSVRAKAQANSDAASERRKRRTGQNIRSSIAGHGLAKENPCIGHE